jgi:hypothetical protein
MKLPKLYNPFKAHIVEFANGKFAVRKWGGVWKYKEKHTFANDDEIHWWNFYGNVEKFCTLDTYEEAVALLKKEHVKVDPTKVVKVHG